MPIAESGHHTSRPYTDHDGAIHTNGSPVYSDESGTAVIPASPSAAGGSALTLTGADGGKIVKLDTAAGTTITLPAAAGTGVRFLFVITTVATSNSHIIKVANASDTMQGVLVSRDDTSDNAVAFGAVAGTDDTITLNRTTTGSIIKGEWIELIDIAANVWQVRGTIANSGTPATPFSATVS